MELNILGTQYAVETHKVSDDETLKKNNWNGYYDETLKMIIVADVSEKPYFELGAKEQEIWRKEILRHEIIHAFLNESGLSASTLSPSGGWARNEEMVDWFAIQFPKIVAVFERAGCI